MQDNKNTTHFQFFVAVHALFIREDTVLLLKRANTGYMDGFFSVPAGHVDGGETIATAMQREIREEVGLSINTLADPALVMHRIVSPQEERIDYFFSITNWKGTPHNAEPHKCSGLEWHPTTNLPQKTVPYVARGIQAVIEGERFVEFEELVES